MLSYLYININDISIEEYRLIYSSSDKVKRDKIDRLKLAKDKKRSLAGEKLARALSENFFGASFKKACVLYDDKGKPYIKDAPFHISISHSGDYAVCALSQKPVGVDIEEIRPMPLSLCERFCTHNELLYITKNDDYLPRLFEIWTLKEAYFKMLGTGIRDLKSVDVLSKKLSKEVIFFDNYILSIIKEG